MAWLGSKAGGVAWLKGCRHGMAHRLLVWLVYCAVILLGAACCTVFWCGFCWCAVSSSGSAVPFCGWACRAMPFSGWLCRSWQLCHGLAYSGLACAYRGGLCCGLCWYNVPWLCHTIAWRGMLCCSVACADVLCPDWASPFCDWAWCAKPLLGSYTMA